MSWLQILQRVFFKTPKIYPKMVLEMGADKPGDIKKLVKIAKPHIGVITNVNPVHLDKGQFKDLEDIRREKGSLIKTMPEDGLAVLNFDDPLVRTMKTKAKKISYGTSEDLNIWAGDIQTSGKQLKFNVHYKDETIPFAVPVLGRFQIYVLLPAITVALKLGLTLKECAETLKDFKLPRGRMNPIAGAEGSQIIDSSYNASPNGMKKALDVLRELKSHRKIAVLGTMNELGSLTKDAHLELGQEAAEVADLLITVGPEAVTIKQGALAAGLHEDQIYTFFDPQEAGHFLKKKLKPKDLILVKGSQNRVRLEKLIKIIMKNPERAPDLLCRQDKAWEKI
jgi:UDP-N-acetylmuramoyl-tripeptide--D-alanyl-D-alanine ligase